MRNFIRRTGTPVFMCIGVMPLVLLLLCAGPTDAGPLTTLLEESFETEGHGTRWTGTLEYRQSSNSYFMRTNGSSNSGQVLSGGGGEAGPNGDRRDYNGLSYTNSHEAWIWTMEIMENAIPGPPHEAELILNPIDIAGYDTLTFTGLFGGRQARQDDYFDLSYSIDGGQYITALSFRYTGSNPSSIALDTDLNGIGDPGIGDVNVLSSDLKAFSFAIPEQGSTLSIRVNAFFGGNASDEFAFDHFVVTGYLPEPGTLAVGSIGLALIALRRPRRRCR